MRFLFANPTTNCYGRKVTVADITHPYYDEKFRDWQKWRYTYEGGQRFIDNYLRKFSSREDIGSFSNRRQITYNPAFAKAAIEEVKNAIFQRLPDVRREGGSNQYADAINGINGGVDMVGSSMASFLGRKVLPELLTMGRVGIYTDMPQISGLSIADVSGKRPYIYIYRAEDIRSWTLDETNNENEFTNVLLRDYVYTYDDTTGLSTGLVSRFRRIWLEDGAVWMQFYNQTGIETDIMGDLGPDTKVRLAIDRIPFQLVHLSDSLLADVANYQVALLNLASSDLAYTLYSNFPFYTEQFDPRSESIYTRKPGQVAGGEASDAATGKTEEIRVGTSIGRKYPKGLERPGFIAPPAEPLSASMLKQEQIKSEIRQLVHLAVESLSNTDKKGPQLTDTDPLEAGLSYIGLELENMERRFSEYWSMYMKGKPATINYPQTWEIKSDSQRREEAESMAKLLPIIPSKTYQTTIAKEIARTLVGRKISVEDLRKIYTEIEKSPGIYSDPATVIQDVINGVCSTETAAKLRCYPDNESNKAAQEHADRLARIAKSQSPDIGTNGGDPKNPASRGVVDADPDPASPPKEKQASKDQTNKTTPTNPVRGKGK